MEFTPESYKLKDAPHQPFIDEDEIWYYLNYPDGSQTLEKVLEKSLSKHRLSLSEVALLVNTNDDIGKERIRNAAHKLKQDVYGDRIVLFAPLYIGNSCINNCLYCGFRTSNVEAKRVTLMSQQIVDEVLALEGMGHKRLILVFGEHPKYTPEYIAEVTKTVYSVKRGNGEIRRVNINAAPLTKEGFATVRKAGIGTYQVFQETYHRPTYNIYHKAGPKRDYDFRITAFDRALEAGLDDVGIGVLFGLYDWRFEVLSLIRHTNHLEACYNVGPHTISFPRIQAALGSQVNDRYIMSDDDFTLMVAILRLAVPYTGLICTARENDVIRSEVMSYGVSQIDAGTKIEIGKYSEKKNEIQSLSREQFFINDNRTLEEVMDRLASDDYLPSFCTACYRKGRTGEHFMEFSVPGFIKRFCTPNAILSFAEYLEDYAGEGLSAKGYQLINEKLETFSDEKMSAEVIKKLSLIKEGKRDLFF